MRVKAVPYLEKILMAPQSAGLRRMVAACMLAEIRRGQGDFLRARQHYEQAIAESESPLISAAERGATRGFYADYRPRAALGLMLTMRRTLGNPSRIRELATDTRARFESLSGDLAEQLLVMEALLERQMGDSVRACDGLAAALSRLEKMKPPFRLLWPEHVKAFWSQSCGLVRARRLSSRRGSLELLRATNIGPWSQAVAAATLLHSELQNAIEDELPPSEVAERLADHDYESPGSLLTRISECADLEGDPYPLSESVVLHAAWSRLAGLSQHVSDLATPLLEYMRRLPPPLCLLRAVEASLLFSSDVGPTLAEMQRLGHESLRLLGPALEEYQIPTGVQAFVENLLSAPPMDPASVPEAWCSAELLALRQRVWP